MQLDMFLRKKFLDRCYPDTPGHQHTDTSLAAAQAIAPDARTLRKQTLDVIRAEPHTADEVAKLLCYSILAIRPRVTELHKLGHITDSGERRRNDSGKLAIVWRA